MDKFKEVYMGLQEELEALSDEEEELRVQIDALRKQMGKSLSTRIEIATDCAKLREAYKVLYGRDLREDTN